MDPDLKKELRRAYRLFRVSVDDWRYYMPTLGKLSVLMQRVDDHLFKKAFDAALPRFRKRYDPENDDVEQAYLGKIEQVIGWTKAEEGEVEKILELKEKERKSDS